MRREGRITPGKEQCWVQGDRLRPGRVPRSPRPDAPYLQPGPRRRERGSRLRAASQPAGHCGGAATRDMGSSPPPAGRGRQWERAPPAIASLSLRRCL